MNCFALIAVQKYNNLVKQQNFLRKFLMIKRQFTIISYFAEVDTVISPEPRQRW